MNRKIFRFWLKKNKKSLLKIGAGVSSIFLFFCYIFFLPNTNFKTTTTDFHFDKKQTYLQLKDQLVRNNVIKNAWSFEFATFFYPLERNYQSGLFQIPKNSSNREIILLLSCQPQKSIFAEIRPYKKRKNIILRFCKKLDIKPTALLDALADSAFVKELGQGFTTENIYCLFIPDTIPVYKEARAKDVLSQLVRHYQRFWTSERETKAARLGLTSEEICILASIVAAETRHKDEMTSIAGLYLNRLQNGKRLQADPTISYLFGHSIKRIRKRHTHTKSPYNTYRKRGLPPGPVSTPSIAAIDAVLNAEQHDFYFFCAKPDNTGYHTFSKTYQEHRAVAKEYHAQLNKKGVK